EDVPDLIRVFLQREGIDSGDLASKNLDRLRGYSWPGNVRELRNVVARAVALSRRGTPFAEMPILVGASMVASSEPAVSADRPFPEAKADWIQRFEAAYLRALLARHGDNLSQAARASGIDRKHLYRILGRLGMDPPRREG